MDNLFDAQIVQFLQACNQCNVKLIMVGGAAVNFHGYRRHSADVDFWIAPEKENLEALRKALVLIGYEDFEFPQMVLEGNQNISIKISPVMDIELITRFSLHKSFEESLKDARIGEYVHGQELVNYRVISFDDLIENKRRAGRPKDHLDILELKRIKASGQ